LQDIKFDISVVINHDKFH